MKMIRLQKIGMIAGLMFSSLLSALEFSTSFQDICEDGYETHLINEDIMRIYDGFVCLSAATIIIYGTIGNQADVEVTGSMIVLLPYTNIQSGANVSLRAIQ